jgi:hypothetical protein
MLWCDTRSPETLIARSQVPIYVTGIFTGGDCVFSVSCAKIKIIHYCQVYLNRPDPIAFMPVTVDTSGHIYNDFSLLLFLQAHREVSALSNELPEESGQFRFLHSTCLFNLKGSVGLILETVSAMRISIPLDLSSRSFIPLPCFFRSRSRTRPLVPSLVFFPPSSA